MLFVGCGLEVGINTNLVETDSNGTPVGEAAIVTWVIDGDTIDVEIDGEEFRVRYIGIDTPERDEPFYEQASAFNRDLVAGETVILVKDVSDTDRYGRLLRYIYLQDGTFVNREIVANGFGRLVTYPPDVSYADEFRRLQFEARSAELGMWALEADFSGDGCNCSRNAYDCRDFDTQSEAQACYEICLASTGEDIHRLDGGGDGLVCEALP